MKESIKEKKPLTSERVRSHNRVSMRPFLAELCDGNIGTFFSVMIYIPNENPLIPKLALEEETPHT